MEAAPADAADECPFLRCITLLNDDVLTAYLLPKLVEQGSAGAVACTCSQLRRLCQRSVQHLDLAKLLDGEDNPCHNTMLTYKLVTAFPNCTSVKWKWDNHCMADVYRSIRFMLAGLPHLSTMTIRQYGYSLNGYLDPVLCQLQLHATALRSLTLQLRCSWEYHDLTWESLGKLVDLTRLKIAFSDQVESPCSHTNLQSLTDLTKLQSLIIKAPGAYREDGFPALVDHQNHDDAALQQFPGPLTSLTELELPLDAVRLPSSISECVGLCDLQLLSNDGIRDLSPAASAALARLTRLTRLHVDMDCYAAGALEAESYYGVLRQLKGLQEVGAYVWSSSFLPVLQTLSHVTAVHGGWFLDPDDDLRGLACPHVRQLGMVLDIPVSAFPNLECVSFAIVSIRELLALSRCCTNLQKLVLLKSYSSPTGGGDSGSAERIAAYRSLADLQHLTHLDLAPSCDAELVAFTSAAAAVSTPRLRSLHVRGAALSFFALMQLQGVRGLKELLVYVADSQDMGGTFTVEAVRMLLVGLALVPKVFLVVHSAEEQGLIDAAARWAAQLELPLPAVLKVSVAKD